jgi:membrane protein DedA with SNARE-associated domain
MVVWTGVALLPLGWYAYGVATAGSNTYSNLAFLSMTWVVLAPSAEVVTLAGYVLRSVSPRAGDPATLVGIWTLSLAGNYSAFVAIPNLLRRARDNKDGLPGRAAEGRDAADERRAL